MKKSLLLLVALACTGAIAQEKQIWACQLSEGALLAWEDNSSWEIYKLSPDDSNLLLTIDGANSRIKMGGDTEFSAICSVVGNNRVSCYEDTLGSEYVLLDQTTGAAGHAYMYGAVSSGSVKDSINIAAYNCTKF